jgi:hypothetical protein
MRDFPDREFRGRHHAARLAPRKNRSQIAGGCIGNARAPSGSRNRGARRDDRRSVRRFHCAQIADSACRCRGHRERRSRCGPRRLDRRGERRRIGNQETDVRSVRKRAAVSPDGSQIAFSVGGEIDVMHVDGSGRHRIVEEGFGVPRWSPDGTLIAYDEGDGIAVVQPDGGGSRMLIPGEHVRCWPFVHHGRLPATDRTRRQTVVSEHSASRAFRLGASRGPGALDAPIDSCRQAPRAHGVGCGIDRDRGSLVPGEIAACEGVDAADAGGGADREHRRGCGRAKRLPRDEPDVLEGRQVERPVRCSEQ